MSSVTRKVACGICDVEIHKNSIQKHQRQHNINTAEDRACLRHWEIIMTNGLARAKEIQPQLANVNEENISKVRRELIKVGKYAVSEAAAPATTETNAATTSSNLDLSSLAGSRVCVYQSPPRRRPRGDVWDTRIGVFTELYKDYCTSESGLYLAESNVRNHMMVLKKAVNANPSAEEITEVFTPATIEAMLIGKGNMPIQNSTRYDYLLILKVCFNQFLLNNAVLIELMYVRLTLCQTNSN